MSERTPRATRYRVPGLTVVYDTSEEFWTGPVVDVSETGMFIETTQELPIGQKVVLMPQGHDSDDRLPFEVAGVVVRVNEFDWGDTYDQVPGIAVRFDGLDAAGARQLEAFLRDRGVEA